MRKFIVLGLLAVFFMTSLGAGSAMAANGKHHKHCHHHKHHATT